MKKVVAIHSSERKGDTYALLTQVGALLADSGAEMETLRLSQLDIRPCAGCEHCILKGGCVFRDDAELVMKKLREADGIVLSSPVYLRSVSGRLKNFVDRTCCWYHRPELCGKPVLCLASTKGSGLSGTLKYMESVAAQWGAMPAGRVGRTIRTIEKPVERREIARFLELMDAPESFRPTVGDLLEFEVQKSLASCLGGLDGAYWRERGWDKKPYFTPCRCPLAGRAVSGLVGGAMRRSMALGEKKKKSA